MQVLGTFQKNLAKVVVFNRIFTISIFVCLAVYIFQLTLDTNIMTIVALMFALVSLVFHLLLIEVIGQIIRKKTILTNDICEWLGKVISISTAVVITVSMLTTGNLYFAGFYCVPIVIGSFLGDPRILRLSIAAILLTLIVQHTGIDKSPMLINNVVEYTPSSLVQSLSVLSIFFLARFIVSNARQTHEKTNLLQSMATTDVLTGLINRRYFDRRLAEEISRCKRHNTNLSLALFDVDFFKRVNDTYGHIIGDKILKELGEIISNNTRESDISARYGGEEFALILPETTQIEAAEFLERIRQFVEDHTFTRDDTPVLLTISIGIAQFDSEYTVDDFINQADASLYQAKRTGRNKVVYGTFTTPRLQLQKRVTN